MYDNPICSFIIGQQLSYQSFSSQNVKVHPSNTKSTKYIFKKKVTIHFAGRSMIEAVQQCNIQHGCEICRVSRIIEDLPCNTLEILHTFLKIFLTPQV